MASQPDQARLKQSHTFTTKVPSVVNWVFKLSSEEIENIILTIRISQKG